MSFTPLHVYTGYSFLKSGLKIENYLNAAKKLGYTSIGISDFRSFVGVPSFYHEATKQGLKPIIGQDLIIGNLLFSFFVLNETGYKNLLKLSLKVNDNSVNEKDIVESQEGLAVVLSTNNEVIKRNFLEDQANFAKKFAKVTRGIANFYVGIDTNDDIVYVDAFREFAFSHGYKSIAFPWIKYIAKEDAIILDMMRSIETKEVLTSKTKTGNEYLLSLDEIKEQYKEDEIKNIGEIVNAVNFDFIVPRGKMIAWKDTDGLTSDEYLSKLANDGLKNKGKIDKVYQDRLNLELNVIKDMGYSDYFLIVQDYINYAREHDIAVGPGRGSAAGSLVSYALGISAPDPLKHGLLFERFLNPARQTMPDIDVDFSDIHREEVIDYIRRKYGTNHIARIMAVQKLGAKASLNELVRIFNYEKRDIELFTKLIKDEGDEKASLRDIYKSNPKFRELVNNDKYYLEIVTLASKIEGMPRQTSLHAAGIVLNAESLEGLIPLQNAFDGGYVEEFEKDYIEEQGFLKMDILAIRNLTIVENCLALLSLKGININRDEIPYDDPEAIKIIASGKTMGLFQIESVGMRNAIKTLKIKTFDDVVALLALYRPGPMDSIKDYASKKNSGIKPTYLSPALEEILGETYGTIVYQEQIMQIASKMAGFTLGEADSFRRAVSKKDSKKLDSLRASFVSGAIKKGYKEKEATDVFNLIDKFANYGFNKSHALVYAIFTCRMAYLKAHYPQEFYASILTNSSTNEINNTVAEIRAAKINVLCPDINTSESYFKIQDNSILFPLSSIKGISTTTSETIIEERKFGPYKDLCDFMARMGKYRFVDSQLQSLIDAGAFDSIEPSRATLRNSTASAMSWANMMSNDGGLLNYNPELFPKPSLRRAEDNQLDNLTREYNALGIMISGSPLDVFKDELDKLNAIKLDQIETSKGDIKVGAIIKSVKKATTKDKKQMAFVTIYDDALEQEIVVFASIYEECKDCLNPGSIVVVDGYYKTNREEFSVTKIRSLEDAINGK